MCRASPNASPRSILNFLFRRRRLRIFERRSAEAEIEAEAADPNCPFRCGNGNCRSLDVVCSGKDGCGDNSDESNCQICRELKYFRGLSNGQFGPQFQAVPCESLLRVPHAIWTLIIHGGEVSDNDSGELSEVQQLQTTKSAKRKCRIQY